MFIVFVEEPYFHQLCMYVLYVYIYVCMYVCMSAPSHAQAASLGIVLRFVRDVDSGKIVSAMQEALLPPVYMYMYVCMYACMYVCACLGGHRGSGGSVSAARSNRFSSSHPNHPSSLV